MKALHDMCFRENNNGLSKREYKLKHVNAINVFHDVNSTLYTVTNIAPSQGRDFTKVINVFCSKKSALFMVSSIHRIRKCTKNRNQDARWKVTEDSRL